MGITRLSQSWRSHLPRLERGLLPRMIFAVRISGQVFALRRSSPKHFVMPRIGMIIWRLLGGGDDTGSRTTVIGLCVLIYLVQRAIKKHAGANARMATIS